MELSPPSPSLNSARAKGKRITLPGRRWALSLLAVLSLGLLTAGQSRQQAQDSINGQSGGAATGVGSYHALVIGIDNYKQLRKLKTARADARAVSDLLQVQYGFQTTLLLDADRQQILSSLNRYRRTLTPDAHLLIYFAGHGVNDVEADKAYWQPADAQPDDNANWISADDITTNVKAVPARHILIISDSCYSGDLLRSDPPTLSTPAERRRHLQRQEEGKSRRLMSSGGDEPVLDGGGGGHSVFAGALLQGLKSFELERFTAGELFVRFVQERVAGRTNQLPQYAALQNSGHEDGDFVFVRLTPTPAPAAASAARKAAYRGLELFWKHDCDGAREAASEALRLDPRDALAHLLSATCRMGRVENAAVLEATAEVIRLLRAPVKAEEYWMRGWAYSLRSEKERALPDLDEALRLDPTLIHAYVLRASAYADKEETGRALDDIERVIRLDPKFAPAYFMRSFMRLGMEWDKLPEELKEQEEEALKDPRVKTLFDRAMADIAVGIRLDPQAARGYVNRGTMLAVQQDFDGAAAAFAEALRFNPRYLPAYMERAKLYAEKRDFERALADLSAAIRLHPRYLELYHLRAEIHERKARFPEDDGYVRALADYTEAIRLDPQFELSYMERGRVFRRQHDLGGAVADFTEAIRLSPRAVKPRLERASTYLRQNDFARAIVDYSEAIRLEPDNAYLYSERARAFVSSGDYDRAAADFTEAIRLNPKDMDGYHARANFYLRHKKDYARAIADFTEMIRINPHPLTYEERAEAYEAMGDAAAAKADRKRAEQLKPKPSRP